MSAVLSLLTALMSHPSFDKAKLQSLQLVGMGGTVISPEIILTAEEKLGVRVSVGFGMSEGNAYVSLSSKREPAFFNVDTLALERPPLVRVSRFAARRPIDCCCETRLASYTSVVI